jgi:tRNA(Ile)-lysidine synthase
VDHGLQPGSAQRAADVAGVLRGLGLDPVHAVTVTVPPPAAAGGPEAAARTARYGALEQVARQAGAAAVLLGHTLDDQAETVLLGLARGSGARSLAGMPARRGCYRRPLLAVRRAVTAAACAELGLAPWQDPHNRDDRFARARVRHQVMPALEAALGPGVAEALARTASQLRADAEYLDELAAARRAELAAADDGSDRDGSDRDGSDRDGPADGDGLDAGRLLALPAALRTRLLHQAALAAGCPRGALTAEHVQRVDELVTGWHGQRGVDLPGGVRAWRRDSKVWFTATTTRPARGGESLGRT